ncbi:hypothetical protein [Paenibacillus polymyxa]|uniref:hypothetical protein n=1 Tax=Paenibacillus polymyxa TaxID=1406 RepID=UPI002035E085|nr:hypothetical protein [Paenibacillus polymyxa]
MASRMGIIHKGVLLEELTTKDFETIRRKQLMIGRLKLSFRLRVCGTFDFE